MQELRAKVVVTALALDRFEDDAGDPVAALVECSLGLLDGEVLVRTNALGLRLVDRELHLRIRDARPVELGEVHRLPRIGRVRERHRVARPPVERLVEVEHLVPHLAAIALLVVFAHLPVERGLERVFDGERPAGDEERVRQVLGNADPAERLDEPAEVLGDHVRVRHLVNGGVQQPLPKSIVGRQARMVHAEGARRVEAEEVDVRPARVAVLQQHPLAVVHIEHHLHHPGREHVLRQGLANRRHGGIRCPVRQILNARGDVSHVVRYLHERGSERRNTMRVVGHTQPEECTNPSGPKPGESV